MSNLLIFQQFTSVFPQWKLWEAGSGVYTLAFNPIAGYDTYGYNPDNPQGTRVVAGAYLSFWLDEVIEVKFDGTSLNFRASGQTFKLEGNSGKATVKG